jgi:hypothetical protein
VVESCLTMTGVGEERARRGKRRRERRLLEVFINVDVRLREDEKNLESIE